MKKVLTFSIATLAALAFTAGSSFACGEKSTASTASKTDGKLASSSYNCSASKTDGKLASSSRSCSAAKKDGKLASSGYACSAHKNGTTNAAYANLPVKAQLVAASHDANCNVDGSCQLVNIAVNGMTCGGCEYGVKDALAKVDGVNGVVNVDYNEGIAQVCTGKKVDHAAMTQAVSSTGFEAQIIPAVAKTTSKSATKANLAGSGDKANCSAACLAKYKNASAKTTAKKVSDTPAKGDTY